MIRSALVGISVGKYQWVRKKKNSVLDEVVFGWRVRWKIGTGTGRRPQKERCGFPTKAKAEFWVQKELIPAINEGYDSPQQMQEALALQNLDEDSKRRCREMTIGAWVDEYTATYMTHLGKRSKQHTISILKTAVDHWGKRTRLTTISPRMVTEFVEKDTAAGRKPSTDTKRNRMLNIRKVFNQAVQEGIISCSPCVGLKLPKLGIGRVDYLNESEIARLLISCENHQMRTAIDTTPAFLKAFVGVAIYTGARVDELFHMEWTDISTNPNTREKRITIQPKRKWGWTPKNGKPRTISLNPEVVHILEEHRADFSRRTRDVLSELKELELWASDKSAPRPAILDNYKRPPGASVLIRKASNVHAALLAIQRSNLIFPSPTGDPLTDAPKGLATAVERSAIRKNGRISPHILRHTFCSHLVMAGVDLTSVQKLMGHSDIKTTMRYAHLAPDHAAAAALKLPSFLRDHEQKQHLAGEVIEIEELGRVGS